jgi:halocyanin-like protein
MTENDTCGGVGRRDLLKATCAVGVATAASPVAGRARAQEDDFGEWFENVDNYDGIQNRTGNDQVTVTVGSEANGGNYGFDPAAIRVDPGTEVVWEWRAGSHNVVHHEGDFESELTDEEGFTFTQTFDEDGVNLYYCTPHRDLGMKGAVVVGDVEVDEEAAGDGGGDGEGGDGDGGDGGDGGDTDEQQEGGGSGGGDSDSTEAMLIGVSMLAAFLSPIAFALFLFARGGESENEPALPR